MMNLLMKAQEKKSQESITKERETNRMEKPQSRKVRKSKNIKIKTKNDLIFVYNYLMY